MKLTEQMTFRTTPEILTAIKNLAKESNTTASQVINDLLMKSLNLAPYGGEDEAQELKEIREMLMRHEQWISKAENDRKEMIKK